MAEKRDIKYINREFGDFKQQLIQFAKNYFPDTYNDFSPASPGMMFIEMAAYVGDILSFYQDTQLQETFLQYAKNPANIYTMAYMMGYTPKMTSVSEVNLTITQKLDAIGTKGLPNWDQALQVKAGSQIQAQYGGTQYFYTYDNVDFSFSSSESPTIVSVSKIAGGIPSEYTLTKTVKAISGTINSKTFTVNDPIPYQTLYLEDSSIVGVLDITDSDGNVWYEVPFLGQDTIFDTQSNTSSDKTDTPYLLNVKKVSRRFVTRFTSNGTLQIQFGAGVSTQDDNTYTPDPSFFSNSILGGKRDLDKAYDPSNFLFTKSYGLAPSNTDLTVRYLVGGGVQSNVPAGTITVPTSIQITGVDTSKQSTLTIINNAAAYGGRDGDTIEEIRQNAVRAFAEQKRLVTAQDYTIRSLSLPSIYGSISKAFAVQDYALSHNSTRGAVESNNPLAISVYVLGYDYNGNLKQVNTSLKQNLKTYLNEYKMMTDSINIRDAFIVNIGVEYEIIVKPSYNGRDTLVNCTERLKEYFKTNRWSINQPISLSEIYSELDNVVGVQTVEKVKITNLVDGDYSKVAYDIDGATKKHIIYPSYDPMIFEVKYPNKDIKGRITTL
jgi:hypothetical protein